MAIAVFDSGIGGLSVLQQARMILPEKDYSGMINNCSDIFQLKTFIGDLLNTVKQLLTQSTKKYSDFVQETISYIQDHIAEDLLAGSTLRTFEIADSIGIHDAAYFSSLFKKNTGLSPKEYRNQFIHQTN